MVGFFPGILIGNPTKPRRFCTIGKRIIIVKNKLTGIFCAFHSLPSYPTPISRKILTFPNAVNTLARIMVRRPGQALITTYVKPTSQGKFQARVKDPHTGKDVKVTATSITRAIKKARKQAGQIS